MASRNSTERGAVVAQSACPLFALSVSVSAAAAVFPLPPWSVDLAPNARPAVAEAGQLYILQCTQNMNVRLIGNGTTVATQTVTYTAPSGAQTVTIAGWVLSFTSSGVQNTDAATLVSLINSDVVLARVFNASAAANVVTITYKVPGAGGNFLTLAVTGTGAAAGGATFAGGAGPTAGTTAANAYFVTANQPFFVYRLPNHTQLDVLAAGAGTLQIFLGA